MKTMSKSSLYRLFIFIGLLGIIFGFIHLASGLTSEFTTIIIGDMIINTLSGLLFFCVCMVVIERKTSRYIYRYCKYDCFNLVCICRRAWSKFCGHNYRGVFLMATVRITKAR